MSVFARISKLVVLLALACSIGLHWFMLQSLAWTTMLGHNLRTGSLASAIERTFDGKHPCPLCLAIAKGKSSEKKAEFEPLVQKLEFVSSPTRFVFSPPTRFVLMVWAEVTYESLAFPPPTPPPRPFAC